MSKEFIFRITTLLLALVGLVVLWQSTVWGMRAVPGIIVQIGAISGDIQQQVVYQSQVTALQIAGGILFGVGLWRAIQPLKEDHKPSTN